MIRVFLHELLWQARIYARDPMALFFVVAFPIAFIAFQYLRGGPEGAFLVGLGVAMSVALANFAGLAIGLAAAIERGVLTRLFVSPLPISLHFTARILAPLGLILLATGLLLLFAHFALSLDLGRVRPALLLFAIALGAFSFGALGVLLGVLARRTSRASFLSQVALLPLFLLELLAKDLPLLWLSPLHALLLLVGKALSLQSEAVLGAASLLAWGTAALAIAAKKTPRAL